MNYNEIEMTAVPSKPAYTMQEEVFVEISIKNIASETRWLNGRMLANTKHAPDSHREITLVLSSNDRELPFRAKIRTGSVTSADYILLGAGDSLTKEYCLSDWFDVQSPSEYVLIARFRDGNESPPKAPSGSAYISGPIESECRFSVGT